MPQVREIRTERTVTLGGEREVERLRDLQEGQTTKRSGGLVDRRYASVT